jgi:hypothetical protein
MNAPALVQNFPWTSAYGDEGSLERRVALASKRCPQRVQIRMLSAKVVPQDEQFIV